MNKKILVAFTACLIVAMMLTPLALAKPWKPKSNPKFQSFNTAFSFGDPDPTTIVLTYTPSEEDPNKVVLTYDENAATYEMNVGENTYSLGTDFLYFGEVTLVLWKPEMPLLMPVIYTPSRKLSLTVKYCYDFSAIPGGIDGTIKMQAIMKGETFPELVTPGTAIITSLQGTGDLQNVNIKATGGGGLSHMGIVSGWPE